jgi:phospho-N-acetylmuramoyl-pentapeptide-transferase
MLYWLGQSLSETYGPLRLLTSFLFLAGLGTAIAAVATFLLIPRLWGRLPRDRGRMHAVNAEQSIGKPISAGLIFMPIFIVSALLFVPMSLPIVEGLALVGVAMAVGYLDDASGGWSEYKLGALDAIVGLLGAAAVCQLDPFRLWLPFVKTPFLLTPWLFIPGGAALIWLSINRAACSGSVSASSAACSTAPSVTRRSRAISCCRITPRPPTGRCSRS